MVQTTNKKQDDIKIASHGENYGNWMSSFVFKMMGGIAFVLLVFTILSFAVFKISILGVVFAIVLVVEILVTFLLLYIRR